VADAKSQFWRAFVVTETIVTNGDGIFIKIFKIIYMFF